MIEITENALIKITDILAEENNPEIKLRTFIQGGGCAGFSYGFTLDEIANEDDYLIEKPGVSILIDSISMQYLQGSTIDYKEDLMNSNFVITNPNAVSTCGCGSSFAV